MDRLTLAFVNKYREIRANLKIGEKPWEGFGGFLEKYHGCCAAVDIGDTGERRKGGNRLKSVSPERITN